MRVESRLKFGVFQGFIFGQKLTLIYHRCVYHESNLTIHLFLETDWKTELNSKYSIMHKVHFWLTISLVSAHLDLSLIIGIHQMRLIQLYLSSCLQRYNLLWSTLVICRHWWTEDSFDILSQSVSLAAPTSKNPTKVSLGWQIIFNGFPKQSGQCDSQGIPSSILLIIN